MKAVPGVAEAMGWGGIADGVGKRVRYGVVAAFAVACVCMVITQLSYVVVGDMRLVCVLAPIALSALLLGPRAATVVGASAGFAEMALAVLMPNDVYQTFFVAPWNSSLLLCAIGLVAGLVFARADARGRLVAKDVGRSRRIRTLLLCCLATSAAFSVVFFVSSNLLSLLLQTNVTAGLFASVHDGLGMLAQTLGDAILMTVVCMVGIEVFLRPRKPAGELSLERRFGTWAVIVLAIGFVSVLTICHALVSLGDIRDASTSIDGTVGQLVGLLSERDELYASMNAEADVQWTKVEKINGRSIGELALDLPVGDDALVVLGQDGVVVSATDDSFLGNDFFLVLSEGLIRGIDMGRLGDGVKLDWYARGGERSIMRALEVPYTRGDTQGSYQVMVALPVSSVFSLRGATTLVLALALLLVFAAVYALTIVLVRKLVLADLNRANHHLGRVVAGRLDEVLNARSSAEFRLLSNGINQTVSSLDVSGRRIQRGMELELRSARTIRESMLPHSDAPFPQIDSVDIHACMRPASEPGGDFYDYFLLDDHTLALFVARVRGKGVPAALRMMRARDEIVRYLRSGVSLSDAVESASTHLHEDDGIALPITAWVATLDCHTGMLTYVNAGHGPALLRREGDWEWVRHSSGIFLGAMEMARYPSFNLILRKEDMLLLHTAGVMESRNAEGEPYGERRLEELASGVSDVRPKALVEAAFADLAEWSRNSEQTDDVTLLAVAYGMGPDTQRSQTFAATEDSLEAARLFVRAELEHRLCPVWVRNKVDLAFDELFGRICLYAHADQGNVGTVRVSCSYEPCPSTLHVELRDDGSPFDPLSPDDADGDESLHSGRLGIPMARKCVDDIAYRREDDQNVVTFSKSWPD